MEQLKALFKEHKVKFIFGGIVLLAVVMHFAQ